MNHNDQGTESSAAQVLQNLNDAAESSAKHDLTNDPTLLKDQAEAASLKRQFGIQPGGGILNVYQFDPQEFGSIGNVWISEIFDSLRMTRRKSFKVVKAMLDAYKLLQKDEEVQHIALGTNKLGHRVLVVVGVIHGGPM